jgi:hypothetical protein
MLRCLTEPMRFQCPRERPARWTGVAQIALPVTYFSTRPAGRDWYEGMRPGARHRAPGRKTDRDEAAAA